MQRRIPMFTGERSSNVLYGLALAEHRVRDVEPRELPLLRAPQVQRLDEPVVAVAPRLELERADAVVLL